MTTETASNSIAWRRTPLPEATLRELNERSDFKGWLQAGGYLGSMVVTGLLSYWAWTMQLWWLLAALVFLHGTIAAFCINAVHELVHGTVFKTARLNDVFAYIFAFIGWINHRFFWISHTEHHKYTLHAPDDLEVVVPIEQTLRGWFKGAFFNLYGFAMVGRIIRYAMGRLSGEWENALLPPDAKKRRNYVFNWARIILLGHLTITGVSLAAGQWIIPILTSLTPFYAYWLFSLCNNTQHVGLSEDVNDFRLNSRTFHINPVLRFFYWHMNYHIEHHMYAAVPCYNLKKLHEAIRHELPPTPRGLIETWIVIGYIMMRQKADPNYRYIPELPPSSNPDAEATGTGAGATATATRKQRKKARAPEQRSSANGRRWECQICGFIYEEALGLPEEGIAPGTAWEEIPDDWSCPDCGVSKAEFEMVEIN